MSADNFIRTDASLSDIDIEDGPIDAETAARNAKKFAQIPVIQAAVNAALRTMKERDAAIADAQGETADKTLEHAKLDADKAKKDEGDPLTRIMDAINALSSRMDSFEKKAKGDAAKADEKSEEEVEEKGDGEEEPEERDEKEKAKRVVADSADAISDWRSTKLERVMTAHGLDSVRPLQAETLKGYQVRVLTKLKKFSEKFKSLMGVCLDLWFDFHEQHDLFTYSCRS
jgi:hypothetical protein